MSYWNGLVPVICNFPVKKKQKPLDLSAIMKILLSLYTR
jgi:hypothetical protein